MIKPISKQLRDGFFYGRFVWIKEIALICYSSAAQAIFFKMMERKKHRLNILIDLLFFAPP